VKLIKRILKRLSWLIDDFLWIIFNQFQIRETPNINITIGITTFMDRYDNCLKPLLKKLALLFPKNEIIVIANGHVKKTENIEYLKKIKSFCSKFQNVKLISYEEPKGLSFIWNQIINSAETKDILLLNDDVKVKFKFRKWLNNENIIESNIATINSSWSHFLISKMIFKKIGPFDEGLIEIGGEDDDYSARIAMNNIAIKNFRTSLISNKLSSKRKRLTVNSYGKNMNEQIYGYSDYNNNYLAKKWKMSNEPFGGSIEVPNSLKKYWKLRND